MENYITAKNSPKSNNKIHKKRVKKLLVAIFSNLVIKKALLLVKTLKLLKFQYQLLQKKIKKDLEFLIQKKVIKKRIK